MLHAYNYNETTLKWVYSNSSFNLIPGIYDLRIYSNSDTDLDIVVVYPTESTSSFEKIEEVLRNSPVENIFATEDDKNSPANIVGYHKINPTKYLLKINNAIRPYVLSFAESYDPLWQIDFGAEHRIDNNTDNNYRTNSMPLYGLTNGFYINKTGDYEMIWNILRRYGLVRDLLLVSSRWSS